MKKKYNKFQQSLKQVRFRTSFRLTLYLHQFISISLAKQGYYFVTATLCPKVTIHKQHLQQMMEKSISKSFASEVFKVQYNNHNEILGHMATFTFVFEQTVPSTSSKQKNKLMLVFQLYRCVNDKSEQPERKLQEQYESAGQFTFEINTSENLSFIQYFQVKFQYPFAAQVNGVAICLMTNFQSDDLRQVTQLQRSLTKQEDKTQCQNYNIFIKYLKRLLKKHRFASYTVLSGLSEAFLSFKNILTIPNIVIDSAKIKKALITSTYLQRNYISSQNKTNKKEHINNKKDPISNIEDDLQLQQNQIQMESIISKSGNLQARLEEINEKQCTEEEFIQHLANIEFQDKQIKVLVQELQNTGKKNLESLKQLLKIVRNYRNSEAHLPRVNLEAISTLYENKKCSLYTQKITIFGQSLPSASEEMKKNHKTLECLKTNQKQSNYYFMKMHQLFNLIPDSYYDFNSINFDKCPYVIYSHQHFQNGVLKEHLDQEVTPEKSNSNMDIIADIQKKIKKDSYRNLFILAHGYQASSSNMEKLKISLKKIFRKSKFLCLRSYSNYMDRSLEQMGQKTAKEIEAYVKQTSQNTSKKLRIVMLGHSMGGIILRASFEHLNQKIKQLFHTFISFATPHLGYLHCKSFITGTGIKLIQSMHPSLSLKQLSNKDNSDIKQTFIYKLCEGGTLRYFENIIVLSSIEDKYVPWNSARIQLDKQPEGVNFNNIKGGWQMNSEKEFLRYVEKQMTNKIFGLGSKESKVKGVHRFEVDFNIIQFNLDTVIGRTAHVAFLNNEHLLSIIFQSCLAKTLYKQLQNS